MRQKMSECSNRSVRTSAPAFLLTTLTLSFFSNTTSAKPLNWTKTPNKPIAVAGQYLVELNEFGVRAIIPQSMSGQPNAKQLETISSKLKAQVVDVVRENVLLVRGDENKLRESSFVQLVEPDFIMRTSRVPNDPMFDQTWGLKNIGALDPGQLRGMTGVDVGAEAAWNISTGSKSVIVAVIDTGVDFSHPDLAPQAWTNMKELNGVAGVDDDANGFVDDIHGYNFVANKGDPFDDFGHGTHCAGTIGAKGNDGLGVAGVNWDVSIMALKFMGADGSGDTAAAIKAVDYARKNGAKILSNSWGSPGNSVLLGKAIDQATAAGILFVAAASNEGTNNDVTPNYPANYANVVAVAAVDGRGSLTDFSNYGAKTVHVAAPGMNILSTVPGGKYESMSGTSMATPHVAGIAALVLSHEPNLTVAQLRERILNTAQPLFSLKGKVSTGGMANAFNALANRTAPADPNDPNKFKNVMPYTLSTAHPYADKTMLQQTIRVPGAKRLAVRFKKFETELAFDQVSFFEASYLVGSTSGTQAAGMISPVVLGDTIHIQFSSDETEHAYGFDIDAVLWE